jgi:LPXTG-site transpeptidase (sortase) family protein
MPSSKAKKTSKSKKKKTSSRFKFKTLLYRLLAIICLVIAICIFTGNYPKFPSKQTKDPIKVSSALYANKVTENIPVRIVITRVNIDLPVVDAKVIDGYWELSENTASYGEGSGVPGQSGNTVIFAHAREGLFYNLKDVKLGDIVYVFTKDKWFRYKVNKITAVYPNQIEVISPTKNQTLTLYTCTGFVDEKRLVISAIPQN